MNKQQKMATKTRKCAKNCVNCDKKRRFSQNISVLDIDIWHPVLYGNQSPHSTHQGKIPVKGSSGGLCGIKETPAPQANGCYVTVLLAKSEKLEKKGS